MNITPKVIGFAIYRLLLNHRVSQGSSLPLRVLMEDWPQTLLRKADLGVGITTLRQSGHLALEQTPEGPLVRVLNEEFGMVRTPQDREAVATLTQLREVRRRPKGHLATLLGGPDKGRRKSEQAASAPSAGAPTAPSSKQR